MNTNKVSKIKTTSKQTSEPDVNGPKLDVPKTLFGKKKRTKKSKVAEDGKSKTKTDFKQSRNFCFTDFKLLDLKKIYDNYNDIIRYICWGEEITPTTGKKHYQGWIQFINKKTLGGVKRVLGSNEIHIEVCRGDEFSNEKYCKKDNNFQQFGTFTCQGARSDLEVVAKMIRDEKPLIDIANENIDLFMRNRSGIMAYRQLVQQEKSYEYRNVTVEVIEGSAGSGKTRAAYEGSCKENRYFKTEGTNLNTYWDGYDYNKTIIIDEFANQCELTRLLTILDGVQLAVNQKHSGSYARWERVIITTNLPWDKWYPNANMEHRRGLWRRIKKWTTYKILDYDDYTFDEHYNITYNNIEKKLIKDVKQRIGIKYPEKCVFDDDISVDDNDT